MLHHQRPLRHHATMSRLRPPQPPLHPTKQRSPHSHSSPTPPGATSEDLDPRPMAPLHSRMARSRDRNRDAAPNAAHPRTLRSAARLSRIAARNQGDLPLLEPGALLVPLLVGQSGNRHFLPPIRHDQDFCPADSVLVSGPKPLLL